jgi:outer membrane protein assembly factor BamB
MKIALRTGAGFAAVALGLALAATPAFAAKEDATAFQINPSHDGNIHLKKFRPVLDLKWSRDLGGDVSYPLIVDGVVYVTAVGYPGGGYGTTLYAMDLNTGDIMWQQPIAGTYFISGAAYDNGQVYVLNFDGQMRAFDAKTGTPGWSVHMGSEYFDYGPPVAYKGKVYAAEAGLYALDEETGAQAWGATSGGDGAAIATRNDVYMSIEPYHVKYSSTGAQRWQQETGSTGGTGAYYNKRIYSRGGAVLDDATGDTVATLSAIDFPAAFWTDSEKSDFRLGVSNGQLSSVNAQSGATAWSFSGDFNIVTAPIVINDFVAVGSGSGTLYLLDAATGAQRWSHAVPTGISRSSEGCCTNPWAGMAAGDGALAVPGGSSISVFMPRTRRH